MLQLCTIKKSHRIIGMFSQPTLQRLLLHAPWCSPLQARPKERCHIPTLVLSNLTLEDFRCTKSDFSLCTTMSRCNIADSRVGVNGGEIMERLSLLPCISAVFKCHSWMTLCNKCLPKLDSKSLNGPNHMVLNEQTSTIYDGCTQ